MRLQFDILLLAFSTVTSALPSGYQKRDADLASLQGLTHVTHDRSGRAGDPEGKYFHEATFHSHYDGRFAMRALPNHERQYHLTNLVRTYFSMMHSLGTETWIMHGSLLGWWWNRRIMPWDDDVDVQVSERTMAFLASYHNMTVHHFKVPRPEEEEGEGQGGKVGRNYMLEVNPNWRNASVDDKLNVIDARWIDISTGLFIDITTLRWNTTSSIEGHMMCKDGHQILHAQIFPLRDSVFEGMTVKVPFAYAELLEEEYGPEALTQTEYQGHQFDREKLEWVPIPGYTQTLLGDGSKEEDVDTEFHQFGRGKKAPNRGHKPSRKPADAKAGPEAGKVGEVHHAPGSALDF